MPKYTVTVREQKWAGKPFLRGETFEAKTEREAKQADLLVRLGKAERVKRHEPVRHVATLKAPPAPEPEPVHAAEPEAEVVSEPAADLDAAAAPEDEPAPSTYRTRRLKAED